MTQKRHIDKLSRKYPANVLVLGSNGKLGRMLRRVWEDRPDPNVNFIWQARKQNQKDCFVWSLGDPIESLPPITAIIALWGVTPKDGANLADNSMLAKAAHEIGVALGVERILHCSSAAVYPPSANPLKEEVIGSAPNPYGQSKRDMEQAIEYMQKQRPNGPLQCAMRIGNVAGADSLFATIKHSTTVNLPKFSDGQGPRRSYIAPSDLGKSVLALLKCPLKKLPRIVNVAAQTATPMSDLAHASNCKVVWNNPRPNDIPIVELDTARLNTLLPLGKENSFAQFIIDDWKQYGVDL